MQFLYYTTFRLDCFHLFFQNLFNFKMGKWGFNYKLNFSYNIFIVILYSYTNLFKNFR